LDVVLTLTVCVAPAVTEKAEKNERRSRVGGRLPPCLPAVGFGFPARLVCGARGRARAGGDGAFRL